MKGLIDRLRKNNIHISIMDGNLKLAFDNEPGSELLEEIKSNKQNLMRYLEQQALSTALIKRDNQEFSLIAPNQMKLWAIDKLLGKSKVYNIPSVYAINGFLSIEHFSNAWEQILQRHEVLRSVFVEKEDANTYQIISEKENPLKFIDAQNWSIQKREEYIKSICEHYFDLQNGPLCISFLIQIGKEEFVWVLNFHHIIFDGWSSGVFLNQFQTVYSQLIEGKTLDQTNSETDLQYRDYAAWHHQMINKNKRLKAYWKTTFEDLPDRLQLPSHEKIASDLNHEGASVTLHFDEHWLQQLKRICTEEKATLFSGLVALVNATLSKLSGQTDIVIGTPSSGRDHPQLQDLIGFFVNTVPIRNKLNASKNFKEHLHIFSNNINEAFEHQWLPFDQIVELLDIPFNPSQNPLFDVFIALQNIEQDTTINEGDTGVFSTSPYNLEIKEVAKFDLTFAFSEFNGKLELYLNYDTSRFNITHINTIKEVVGQVFYEWVKQPVLVLNEVNSFPEARVKQLIELGSNPKDFKLSNGSTILHQLEQVFISNATDNCLTDKFNVWTYSDFSESVDKIAWYLLQDCAIKKGDMVLLSLPKSNWTIAFILGIMKAGGVYLPVDASLPKERMNFIESDASAQLIVDQKFLEKFLEKEIIVPNDFNFPVVQGRDTAYCIFTSGSTGKPKGVLVRHDALLKQTLARLIYYDTFSNALLIPPLYFDASIATLFPTFLSGAVLHCFDVNDKSSADLVDYITDKKIDFLLASPSFYKSFLMSKTKLSSVTTLVIGGEATTNAFKQEITSIFLNAQLYVEYGLTEAAVVSTILEWNKESKENSIGKPFFNNEIFLLNPDLHLVPYGSIGEICIGGVGLARGYLNRPELTKEKFITNPYNPSERLYRTGDLGRWREDGNLEYLGRMDDQVKIRGYRIELGEIEQAISSHPHSSQAVVIARAINNTSDKELIAYTTGEATAEELKTYLKERLPSYMVPNYYVHLQCIPLTSNGKVDRKALPDPEGTGMQQATYIAPKTETEKKLVKIWSTVLGVEEATLSIKADFFDSGGHSLRAIKLMSILNREFSLKNDLAFIFTNSSIEEMANVITSLTYNSKSFEHTIRL
jgi:amino acid adenylation domain-containing protein